MRERSVRWKAPECVISNGPDPSFEADVFALGLCLIEAWVGETPYGMQSDDEIEILFRTGHTLERPDNLPDSVWNAVKQLCAFDPANRPTIDEVVTLFRELADQEQRNEEKEEEAARVATAPTDTTDNLVKVQHENVVRFYGACDAESPAFIVHEHVSNNNFNEFFAKFGKAQLWRLFYQAALGLRHLHRKGIIHGDLRCINLFVGKDGLAKVGGLGHSYAADLSAGNSANPTDEAIRWKAPERCEGKSIPESCTASDLYSFGVSLWEAAQGELPYDVADDETITGLKLDGVMLDRPEGLKDDEWEFLQLLLARDWNMRPRIDQVIETLDRFAKREAKEEVSRNCTNCSSAVPSQYRFCGICGHKVLDGVSGAVDLVPSDANEDNGMRTTAA